MGSRTCSSTRSWWPHRWYWQKSHTWTAKGKRKKARGHIEAVENDLAADSHHIRGFHSWSRIDYRIGRRRDGQHERVRARQSGWDHQIQGIDLEGYGLWSTYEILDDSRSRREDDGEGIGTRDKLCSLEDRRSGYIHGCNIHTSTYEQNYPARMDASLICSEVLEVLPSCLQLGRIWNWAKLLCTLTLELWTFTYSYLKWILRTKKWVQSRLKTTNIWMKTSCY